MTESVSELERLFASPFGDPLQRAVKLLARELNLDPAPILRDMKARPALAQFVAGLLDVEHARKGRGRPSGIFRSLCICVCVEDLITAGMSEDDAIKAAPRLLSKLGVEGKRVNLISQEQVRRQWLGRDACYSALKPLAQKL